MLKHDNGQIRTKPSNLAFSKTGKKMKSFQLENYRFLELP
jgi:hypothetical protein